MSLKTPDSPIPSYRQRLGYHSGLLGGIGFLAGAALMIAHVETHNAIQEAKAADQRASLEQVIPAEMYNNNVLQDTLTLKAETGEDKQVYLARKDGKLSAVAYEMGESGYSGTIQIILGIDPDGKLLGVRTLGHSETPGLGDKIEIAKNNWVLSFNGKSLSDPQPEQWGVKKDGGVFDQFTGATITPRAYVKAVKRGLVFFNANREQILAAPVPVPEEKAAPAAK